MEEPTVCGRTACDRLLNRGSYRIWNDPPNGPRSYCISCGRKIIEYNQSQKHDIQLKFEIVRPAVR